MEPAVRALRHCCPLHVGCLSTHRGQGLCSRAAPRIRVSPEKHGLTLQKPRPLLLRQKTEVQPERCAWMQTNQVSVLLYLSSGTNLFCVEGCYHVASKGNTKG